MLFSKQRLLLLIKVNQSQSYKGVRLNLQYVFDGLLIGRFYYYYLVLLQPRNLFQNLLSVIMKLLTCLLAKKEEQLPLVS